MSAKTGIQWTDATWNPVVGCDRVSPGCAHCYAKQLHDMRHRASLEGKVVAKQYAVPFETVQLKPERLTAPLSWRKPRRVFVNSVADLFHDDVPDEFIDRVFAIMALTPWHTHQVLTKRPARALAYMQETWQPAADQRVGDTRHARVMRAVEELVYGSQIKRFGGDRWWTAAGGCIAHAQAWPLPNVWLGVSVENQRFADERIPELLATPAAVRFLSCEPLLGPVDLTAISEKIGEHSTVKYSALEPHGRDQWRGSGIDWVIVGGESGRDARPCHVDELTDLVAQCDLAGVPCFVKQMGSRPVTPDLTHWRCPSALLPDGSGYALRLRDSHGGDADEWPAELRVRRFPGEVFA